MKRKYLDNYKAIYNNENNKNSWQYTGKVYYLDIKKSEFKKYSNKFLVAIVLQFLIVFIFGFSSSMSTRLYYVEMPYILQLFPIFYLFLAIYNMKKIKRNVIEEPKYNTSVQRLLKSSIALSILSILTCIGLLVFALNFDMTIIELIFICSEAVVAILSLYIIFVIKNIKFSIKNETIVIKNK